VGSHHQMPFLAPAQSAARKLESSLPPALRKQLRSVADAIRIRLEPANPLEGQSPVYQQLLDAIALRRCVRIEYNSFTDGQVIRTRLSTYRMLFSRHSWYAIGRSSLYRAVRTFNVGRFRRLEIAEENYSILKNFSLEHYLGNAWHLVPELGPNREVLIRFAKKVAGNVAEVAWHKTQRLQWNPDGTLEYRVSVSGLNEISWWILGYGDQAQVIEPPELRQLIVKHAQRMLEQYQMS
jgi:predicted DNA-binding transcriptional regulator YafY